MPWALLVVTSHFVAFYNVDMVMTQTKAQRIFWRALWRGADSYSNQEGAIQFY